MSTIAGGETGRKRQMIEEILDGCWLSCVEPDPETKLPFVVADVIIANPPSFAHIHCAQALRVPLHMMFTMSGVLPRHFHIHWQMPMAPAQMLRSVTICRTAW